MSSTPTLPEGLVEDPGGGSVVNLATYHTHDIPLGHMPYYFLSSVSWRLSQPPAFPHPHFAKLTLKKSIRELKRQSLYLHFLVDFTVRNHTIFNIPAGLHCIYLIERL